MEKRYFTAIQHAADCVLKQFIFWWRKDNQLAPIWAKMQGTKIAACTIFVNWYKHSNSAVQESFWESVSFLLSMLSFYRKKAFTEYNAFVIVKHEGYSAFLGCVAFRVGCLG